MVKEQVYIRNLSDAEKKALQVIMDETGLKTAKGAMLHALMAYQDKANEVVRLNRIIEYKQRKIERLQVPEDNN